MDSSQLHYLRDIHRQLGGPLRQAVGGGMAGRLQYCVRELLAGVVAEAEVRRGGDMDAAVQAVLRDRRAELRTLLGDDAAGETEDPERASTTSIATRLAARDDPPARRALQALLQPERDYWRRIGECRERLDAAAAAHDDHEVEPLTADQRRRLLALLREQYAEDDTLAIAGLRALAGGLSKQTILVSLSGNRHLPDEIVLRRDRAESPVGSTVLDEFELLKTVHAAGVVVPRPLAVDAGQVMGAPLLVSERVAGDNLGDVYDVHDRGNAAAAASLARELARLHSIPLDRLTRPLPGDAHDHRAQLAAEIEGFLLHWHGLGQSSALIEAAFAWLLARLDRLPVAPCGITHRDGRFHNILTDAHGVTAILDWELAAIGRPARDLGHAYHHVVQFAAWDAFLAAYGEAGGEVPDRDELDFYILWSDLFIAVYMHMARAGYLQAGGDNIQIAFAGEALRQRNMDILAARMHGLLAR